MQFTDKELHELPCPEKPATYRTSDGSGIQLSVQPSGSKSWQLRWRFLGYMKTTRLGSWPEMDLELARQTGHLLVSRHDPKIRKHPSLWAIADTYTRAKDTTACIDLLKSARRHILPLLPPTVEDLTASHLVLACDDLIRMNRLAPSTLSGLMKFLQRAYDYCEARDPNLPRSPFDRFDKIQKTGQPDTRPIPYVAPTRKNLNDSELMQLLEKFPPPVDPMSGVKLERSRFVRLLLLTGLRREELRLLRYSEVFRDAEIPHIRLEAHRKKGRHSCDHELALSNAALTLIGVCPPTCEDAFVFPKMAKQSPTATTKALSRAVPSIGANPHRFRFTLANRLAHMGCPGIIIARILSHSAKSEAPSITQYYMDADTDHQLPDQLPWMEKIAAHLGL